MTEGVTMCQAKDDSRSGFQCWVHEVCLHLLLLFISTAHRKKYFFSFFFTKLHCPAVIQQLVFDSI